jgi:hypothetical protein
MWTQLASAMRAPKVLVNGSPTKRWRVATPWTDLNDQSRCDQEHRRDNNEKKADVISFHGFDLDGQKLSQSHREADA